jgi:tetratricopeptide (TPR) repeat protein
MSVINKMLQDLDRRNAMAGADAQIGPQSVKPVEFGEKRGERDWFWRVVAGLLLAAVGWVGWVAWQLQPRPLVIESAIRAAAPKPPPPPVAVSPVKAAPVAPEPKVEKVEQAEKVEPAEKIERAEGKPPAPEPKAHPAETFKLARAIETPIVERKPEPAKPKPRAAAAPKAATPVAAAAKPKPRVTKTAVNEAEMHFRRAAAFLNQGRVSEAQAHLGLALKADPAHAPARQAYVALALEHGRVAEARELLQAGVAANPAHAPFALALARIHVEQREYSEALKVLDDAGPAGQSAEFQGLRAVVLQRTGRHGDAVEAFQQALRNGPQTAATWMGLGISLEALGHRAEAAQAYRRALGAGMLAVEVRDYAEARIRALD